MDSDPICSKLNNYTAKQHITSSILFKQGQLWMKK